MALSSWRGEQIRIYSQSTVVIPLFYFSNMLSTHGSDLTPAEAIVSVDIQFPSLLESTPPPLQ